MSATAALVRAEHLAQIFGIKPRGECGRIDQVDEHHRQLPPLGIHRSRHLAAAEAPEMSFPLPVRGRGQRGDCVEKPAAVTDRGHADRDQVVCRQPRQEPCIDVIVAERLLVPLKPQAPQPACDVHCKSIDAGRTEVCTRAALEFTPIRNPRRIFRSRRSNVAWVPVLPTIDRLGAGQDEASSPPNALARHRQQLQTTSPMLARHPRA